MAWKLALLLLIAAPLHAGESEELALAIAIYNYEQKQASTPVIERKLKPLGIQWNSLSEVFSRGETALILFADESKPLEALLDQPKVARAFNQYNCVRLSKREAAVFKVDAEKPVLMTLTPKGDRMVRELPMDPQSIVNLLTPE